MSRMEFETTTCGKTSLLASGSEKLKVAWSYRGEGKIRGRGLALGGAKRTEQSLTTTQSRGHSRFLITHLFMRYTATCWPLAEAINLKLYGIDAIRLGSGNESRRALLAGEC